jgi:undecaprenyl diphosphate synthase
MFTYLNSIFSKSNPKNSKKKNQDNNNNNLPKHVAIIPDGNRRWAIDKNLPTSVGHSIGSKRILKSYLLAFNLGIYCISVWGSSYENLTKRSTLEIKSLFKIYKKAFESLLNRPELHEKKIKVMIIGRWREVLDKSVIEVADKLMDTTKMYDGHSLNFCIGYSGTDEMIHAIKEIVEESKKDEKNTNHSLRDFQTAEPDLKQIISKIKGEHV